MSSHQPNDPYAKLANARFYAIGSLFTMFFVWWAITEAEMVSSNILPSPGSCLKAFIYLSWDSEKKQSLLYNATAASCSRILVSMLLVVAIGLPIGILMGTFPKVNAILSPLIDPFRSAPISALLPVFLVWFGIGEWMKILFLFASSVVYFVPMVRDAIQNVPSVYWMSAVDLGANTWETIKYSLVPMALPKIADAIVTSFSIMFTYLSVAEYVNTEDGLGQLIQNARRFSAMDQVFVGVFVIIFLALVVCKTLSYLKNKMFPWEIG